MSGNSKMMNDENEERGAGSDMTPSASSMGAPGVPPSTLDGDIQTKIGQHLRAMYDDVVRQGVPNRFLDLLSQLDDAPKGGRSGGTGS